MKLSIITINKNNSSGLLQTILSVKMQSFSDFEFIVIDGDSSDDSVETIKRHSEFINYWKSEPDYGVYSAMNKGIMMAKGEYCLFLNSGDCLSDEGILEKLFSFNCQEDIIYGNISLKGETYKYPDKLTLYNLRWGVLPHQASLIKLELFDKYGYYNEQYRIASDWEFWLKTIIVNNCSYKYIDLLITIQEPLGLSAKLDCEEGMQILQSLFPSRILTDYDKFKKIEFYSNTELFRFIEENRVIYKAVVFLKKLRSLKNRILS